MSEPITSEHLELILREMCKRVRCDYDTFDFKQPAWYCVYEWPEEEEKDFTEWLANFLEKHKYVPKNIKRRGERYALHEAKKIVFNYGWRIKNE